MKQSNQFYLPVLEELTPFTDFIKADLKGVKGIAHCEETDKKMLSQLLHKDQDLTMIIGPEGDLSLIEIEMALKNGFIPTSLGTKRLRTETAGVYTAAIFNSITES
jgi:16S rRNA (uracil1498-N3)-methyltransferase